MKMSPAQPGTKNDCLNEVGGVVIADERVTP